MNWDFLFGFVNAVALVGWIMLAALPRGPKLMAVVMYGCIGLLCLGYATLFLLLVGTVMGGLAGYYGGWLDEWHYRGASRSILVEPFIGMTDALPTDYKIYVFGGRAVAVQVHDGRGGDHRWHQYDRHWRALSREAGGQAAPSSLAAMLAAAERLARNQDFMRVDFYEVDGQPLFGEFCLYPGSGLDPFDPPSLDSWLGAQWSAERSAAGAFRIALTRARCHPETRAYLDRKRSEGKTTKDAT